MRSIVTNLKRMKGWHTDTMQSPIINWLKDDPLWAGPFSRATYSAFLSIAIFSNCKLYYFPAHCLMLSTIKSLSFGFLHIALQHSSGSWQIRREFRDLKRHCHESRTFWLWFLSSPTHPLPTATAVTWILLNRADVLSLSKPVSLAQQCTVYLLAINC